MIARLLGNPARRNHRSGVLAAALLLVAAGVWGEPLDEVLAASPYTTSQRREVQSLFRAADESGVPEELLLPRLEEALAKHVPPDRASAALEAELSRLLRARELLGERAIASWGRAAWQRTANLLAWGAREAELEELIRSCVERPRATDRSAPRDQPPRYLEVTHLFAQLVHWGLAREVSLRLAAAAGRSALRQEEFPGLTQILVRARRRRMSPELAALRAVEALESARSIHDVEEALLDE